jgi:hypothetical protein
LPDSTSQKFLLLGQVAKRDRKDWGRIVVVHLDFTQTRRRKCGNDDFDPPPHLAGERSRWLGKAGEARWACQDASRKFSEAQTHACPLASLDGRPGSSPAQKGKVRAGEGRRRESRWGPPTPQNRQPVGALAGFRARVWGRTREQIALG